MAVCSGFSDASAACTHGAFSPRRGSGGPLSVWREEELPHRLGLLCVLATSLAHSLVFPSLSLKCKLQRLRYCNRGRELGDCTLLKSC